MHVVSAAAGVQGAMWDPWMHRLTVFHTVTAAPLALWYGRMVP